MSRARHRSVRGLAALAGLALTAGCSHWTGYVDMRATLTPLGEGVVKTAALEQPLRITREISERNAVLEVRVERLETTEGPAQLDRFGKPTRVRWQWYHPFVKLPLAVTIFPPFFLAYHDPTAHGAGNWSRWDYFYDVGAWYNLCSAMPSDSREVQVKEERVLSEQVVAILSERRAPIPGRSVALSLDGRELARGVTDAGGAARFDLAPFLTPDLARNDHTLRIVTLSETGESAELSRNLEGETLRQLLENRPAPPQPPPAPPGR